MTTTVEPTHSEYDCYLDEIDETLVFYYFFS